MSSLDDLTDFSFAPPPEESPENPKPLWRRVGKWLFRMAAAVLILAFLTILLLRWVNPPTTSFMLQRQFDSWQNGEELEIRHRWVGWDRISPALKMAAITSEDQRFAYHWGLDVNSIQKAIQEYERGEDLRGASTITQQVAKNLFLWPEPSYVRKGIEACLALLIELLWSKERILEVYLNIAEFGNGIYGAEAAAVAFFNTTAEGLSRWQSALMVTALPAPRRYNLANPSQYMIERRTWILKYMELLGQSHYLQKL